MLVTWKILMKHVQNVTKCLFNINQLFHNDTPISEEPTPDYRHDLVYTSSMEETTSRQLITVM